jgi:hypothetical protein
MADRQNQVAHRAALVLLAQADNPIALGEAGLWFDGTTITFVAADGSQTVLGDAFAYGTTGQMVPISGTSDEGSVDAVARIDHDHELADDVVTAAKIAAGALAQLPGAGEDASGGTVAATFAGTLAGDVVFSVTDLTNGADVTADFESTVTVDDQIQQTAEDLSASTSLLALLLRRG